MGQVVGRLKQTLAEAFAGGRATPRGASVGPLLNEIRRQAGGSRRAAARAAGVAESSMRRWEKGARPKDAASLARKLATGIKRLMRPDTPAGGKITVTTTVRKGPKTRVVDVRPDAIERAGLAWERGDYGGMVREFRAGIVDTWYRDNLFRPDPDDESSFDDDDLSYEGYPMGDDENSEPLVGSVTW